MNHITEDRLLIRGDNVQQFCNTNEALLPNGIKVTGLVLEFPGLGGFSCLGGTMVLQDIYENDFTKRCAEHGIVTAYLFPGPWSWMNKGAVRIVDLVADALLDKYGLTEDAPLVVMGGSMGGQSSLIYPMDSRHNVTAAAAHCPCHNTVECFDSMPDFPRTFLSAVSCYEMSLSDALPLVSPEHRVAEMKDIPYFITADELDECIPLQGIERLVGKMKERGLGVEYKFLPGQPHGGITPEDRETLNEFVFKHCGIK